VKRVVIAITAVFILLFVTITVLKNRSSERVAQPELASQQTVDRERVQDFWQLYRGATEHRTAGRTRKAVTEYGRALELNPDHEDALYYSGSMYFELGEFREAEQVWQRLTEVNPGGSRAFSRLGDLYFCFEQADFFDLEAAYEVIERALNINSEETGPLLRLGQIALVRGDANTALQYFDAVTATNFRSVPAYFFKGYIDWSSGDISKAEEQFRLAAEHFKPAEPVQGVLSEGDTRSGKAILAEAGQCQSFQAHATNLPDPDDPNLRSRMEDRYRELATFLQRAR
jgi:tetratricopeptide (TPR) repeat protein